MKKSVMNWSILSTPQMQNILQANLNVHRADIEMKMTSSSKKKERKEKTHHQTKQIAY